MAHLDVNPADLLRAAGDYAELQMLAAAIGPQAVDEVQRIIASHGPMGYPVAVGLVAGLARRTAALDAKAAQFGQYSVPLHRTRRRLHRTRPRQRAELRRDLR